MQMTLRQQLEDYRITFSSLSRNTFASTNDLVGSIWKPDLFFTNEKEASFHKIMKPNVLLMIRPNGSVLYSTRISLTLSCFMNLKFFPMDKRACTLVILSYAWSTDYVVSEWKKHDPV
jgi:hypothetical protein